MQLNKIGKVPNKKYLIKFNRWVDVIWKYWNPQKHIREGIQLNKLIQIIDLG